MSSWPRAPAQLTASAKFRYAGVGRSRLAQVLGVGGLTSFSSRVRFVTRKAWQVMLAMCSAPLPGLTSALGLASRTVSVAPRLSTAFAPRTRGGGIDSQLCSTSASDRRDPPQDSTCRVGFGQCAVRVLGRAHGAFRQHQARRLLYCSPQRLGCRMSGAGARERRPNESFKPMPLRGTA